MTRQANNTNYQQRALEFAVHDEVFLFGSSADDVGRVVAVYPAIGMVEVAYPAGTFRQPVEDLQHFRKTENGSFPSPPAKGHSSVPGGAVTVITEAEGKPGDAAPQRVATAFVKKSLYWAARDRHYKATKLEQEAGSYTCPKCGEPLRKAAYQRASGVSEHLLGCQGCLFLVRTCDVLGDPDYVDDSAPLAEV